MGQDVRLLLIPRVRDGQKDVAIAGFVMVRSADSDKTYWLRLSAIERVDYDYEAVQLGGQFFYVHEDDWQPLLLALARGNGEL